MGSPDYGGAAHRVLDGTMRDLDGGMGGERGGQRRVWARLWPLSPRSASPIPPIPSIPPNLAGWGVRADGGEVPPPTAVVFLVAAADLQVFEHHLEALAAESTAQADTLALVILGLTPVPVQP